MTQLSQANGYMESACGLYTVGVPKDILLNLKLARRTSDAALAVTIPREIRFEPEHVLVNVSGRGFAPLLALHRQAAGRCGRGYETIVGRGEMEQLPDGSSRISLAGMDLRMDNGWDLQLRIENAVILEKGTHRISIEDMGQITLMADTTVSDFTRVIPRGGVFDPNMDFTAACFSWTPAVGAESVRLLHSLDLGSTWTPYCAVSPAAAQIRVTGLEKNREHWFCLEVTGGENSGRSNVAKVYSGMFDLGTAGKAPRDGTDAAERINEAIAYLSSLGGGTVRFAGGVFSTTTIHLKSNVWLYIDKSAEIRALPGCDDEEKCWYSDLEFRKDQTHMSRGPYLTPGNWMTKQDAGHSYFRNALFVGQRLDNVKIVGNGRISGAGALTKSNTVLENPTGYRADKMFSLKLCTNVEIGGLSRGKDLWYTETDTPNEDQPFYVGGDSIGNMLRIAEGGHFVLLATGVDGVSAHDIYAEKGSQVRDILDFMGCRDVTAFNIYAEGAADDIIKLGSDCALGFSRPSQNFLVRNIIGDTACNLFQIGSETADDIQDVCIDNIYVLGSNKAGFSVSVNDGGHIRNVHLNCGGTAGKCRYGISHGELDIGYEPCHMPRSVMRRIRTPFFISLSNRGRVLGGEAERKEFLDDIGVPREELMVKNVPIGRVENVFLRNVDIREVYGASQAKSPGKSRWPAYAGQPRTTPMIVGYKVPDSLGMPNARRDIENILLEEIHMTVKGGNPAEDGENTPRELGVGQFNLRNLAEDDRGSRIPAYGWYARHVTGLTIRDCSVDHEQEDGRFAAVFDDVKDLVIGDLTAPDDHKEKIRIR